MTKPAEGVQTAECQYCRERIWPNWTIYGPVWFAVDRHPSGCEEYECPGRAYTLQRYGPHVPGRP